MKKDNTLTTEKTIYHSYDLIITSDCGKLFFVFLKEKIETSNVLEAVSVIMKNRKMKDIQDIWNITISKNDVDYISYDANLLYQIMGGGEFWKNIEIDWLDMLENVRDEYVIMLQYILFNSENLNDIRRNIKKYFNLDKIYNTLLAYTN